MSVTLTILSQTRSYLSVVINISAILAVFLQKQAPRSDCNTICLSKLVFGNHFSLPLFIFLFRSSFRIQKHPWRAASEDSISPFRKSAFQFFQNIPTANFIKTSIWFL